ERLGAGLSVLLEAVAEDPTRALEDYPLVSSAERRQVLAWSRAEEGQAAAGFRGVGARFREQADRRGDHTAVVCGGKTASYRELAAATSAVARLLRARGVGPETVVGIFLDRSIEQVSAILGVLEVGGTYLPLDPNDPHERTARVLELAGVRWILSRQGLAEVLPPSHGELLCLDQEAEPEPPSDGAADITRDAVAAESLAYLMFTSGSTGEPKGVMIRQASLDNYLACLPGALGIGRDDIYLHTASFTFSSSVRHLLVPLTQGATVVVATAEERHDPRRLLGLLGDLGITVMDTVPAFWRSCIEARVGSDSDAQALRLSLATGAPLPEETPREWCHGRQRPPRFFNMYGQTETTGMVAIHPWAGDSETADGQAESESGKVLVPLGRPVPGGAIYVLDRHSRPVGAGSIGEIHVAGAAPARGYLGQPGLTAEHFLPDPFGSRSGSRLFRTGDLAFFDAEGLLHFAGRVDHQVQIRGFRVEPGEVEAILARHPDVERCAVRAFGQGTGDAELAAFVVLADEADGDFASLRRFLEKQLPIYMLPRRFVGLDELPLTPTGKVEYRSLPEPERGSHRPYVAPSTALERELAELWVEVLEVERVGVEDDFFDLGGHSMRGILIMSRVQERYGVEIPPYRLFEARTVKELAVLVEEHQLAAASSEDL
ncbi:MAG: non-ribosomal peptide synthetase, partial [Acidobacteriota bacterium]